MNKILFVVMFLSASMMLFSFGNKEKEPPAAVVQVTGVVRLIGTAIFPELIITGSETNWHIAKEDAAKLHDLQHRTVTVEAEETESELSFANGRPAGIRRELKNIKIISVE